jgi:hypothetical protein
MILFKRILSFLFLVHSYTILAQLPNSLTEDFLKDSIGCSGLRDKHVITTDNSTILIDSINMIGKTNEELFLLIGQPNFIEKLGNQIHPKKRHLLTTQLEYCLTTCNNKKGGESIIITIKNNIVIGISLRMYCG